jgi:hypothetical protein
LQLAKEATPTARAEERMGHTREAHAGAIAGSSMKRGKIKTKNGLASQQFPNGSGRLRTKRKIVFLSYIYRPNHAFSLSLH